MGNKPTHDILPVENCEEGDGEQKAYFTNTGSAWQKDSGAISCEMRDGLQHAALNLRHRASQMSREREAWQGICDSSFRQGALSVSGRFVPSGKDACPQTERCQTRRSGT
ncbi:hypothetical protein E2K80_01375 [Rhodophyticola sp. CCM32]|uniref:hypothetical protein n=1 Tax=Rhodophyticola sp. CCM32 TaxID=2916397 RepID=UPI00107FC4BC|nr:hypothetical protein [Rhodophyticola sp. CCM32]QBX99540.1 hypothetical protein E2K80_01375 [Rhodophyticola sp. CCM32]